VNITIEEGSATTVENTRVTQLPEPLSPSYRSQSPNWNTPTGADVSTMNRDSTLCFIGNGGRKRNETRGSGPLTSVLFAMARQPVRDSNPSRHLERAIRSVRPVLPSAMPYGSSRASATTAPVEYRAVPASHRSIHGKPMVKLPTASSHDACPGDYALPIWPLAATDFGSSLSRGGFGTGR